jgi:hypothetical protein
MKIMSLKINIILVGIAFYELMFTEVIIFTILEGDLLHGAIYMDYGAL